MPFNVSAISLIAAVIMLATETGGDLFYIQWTPSSKIFSPQFLNDFSIFVPFRSKYYESPKKKKTKGS